jgi:hypothetical protein
MGTKLLSQTTIWKMEIKKEYTDTDLLLFTKKNDCKTNAIQRQLTKSDSLKWSSLYPRTDF